MARLLWGGVLVSLIAFAWGAVYVWRLARDTIGEDRASAAVALLAAYPFAVFFSAPYTESLFLLGAVAAIYHFRRDELVSAAALGPARRPHAPERLLPEHRPRAADLREASRARPTFPNLRISTSPNPSLAAAAPGVGMLIYSAYVHHLTGAWFGWARLHEAWGRSYSGLGAGGARVWLDHGRRAAARRRRRAVRHAEQPRADFRAADAVAGVAAARASRMPLFVLVNLVPPMLAGGVLSMGRLTATLFPLFLALAAIGPAARGHAAHHRVRHRPGAGGRALLHLAAAILSRQRPAPAAQPRLPASFHRLKRHRLCLSGPGALQAWSIIERN